MRVMIGRCLLIAAPALLALLLGACAASSGISAADTRKITEIGDAFVADLSRIIIPARKNPNKLVDNDYVLSKEDGSYGMDVLAEFAVTYDKTDDSEITMVFSGKSFVVSRVVFTGGHGYYLRYEYDRFHPDDISVRAKVIDAVELKYYETPARWEMKLLNKKKQTALFSFRDPA